MSQTKIVITCLILLMAIFFFGLSLNLIDKPQVSKTQSDKDKVNTLTSYNKDSFAKSINNLLSSFAPKVATEDINFEKCAKTSTGFYLNKQNKTCELIILGFKENFKKLTLRPDNPKARIDVRYKTKNDNDVSSWPGDFEDKIELVFLGEKKLEGRTLATITLEACPGISAQNCPYFANRKRIEITIE